MSKFFEDRPGLHHNGVRSHWTSRPVAKCRAAFLSCTNAFGVKVTISMRAAPGRQTDASLQATAQERLGYPLFEGAFFGDIFAPGSPAYVCAGPRATTDIEALRLQKRICTLSADQDDTDDRSACGFRLVGSCSKPDIFTVDGMTFEDPIFVYLKALSTK